MRFMALLVVLWQTLAPSRTPTQDKPEHLVVCQRKTYSLADFDSGATAIVSPDHLKEIIFAKDGALRITRGRQEIGMVPLPEVSADIEVAWSPDSEKFWVTYSEGGAEGLFVAHVYELQEKKISELSKPVAVAFADFRQRYYCKERGNNTYIEGWTLDSKQLLIINEVYPTGDCGESFGRLGAYLVDLQGQIIRRYGNRGAEAIQQECRDSPRARLH